MDNFEVDKCFSTSIEYLKNNQGKITNIRVKLYCDNIFWRVKTIEEAESFLKKLNDISKPNHSFKVIDINNQI